MSRQANVSSIDALRRFQAALREYSEAVQDILANLQVESQRTVDWVQHDRMAYWPNEIRRANDTFAEVSSRLHNKLLSLDGRDAPSCTEEKQAVHRARERLRYTERQLVQTRRLSPIVQHEADEYRGVLAKLGQLVETDLPQAIAALDRMAGSLETYAASARPPVQSPTPKQESDE